LVSYTQNLSAIHVISDSRTIKLNKKRYVPVITKK
jgi:hypothetical protein